MLIEGGATLLPPPQPASSRTMPTINPQRYEIAGSVTPDSFMGHPLISGKKKVKDFHLHTIKLLHAATRVNNLNGPGDGLEFNRLSGNNGRMVCMLSGIHKRLLKYSD
jgi:hypothetical protein